MSKKVRDRNFALLRILLRIIAEQVSIAGTYTHTCFQLNWCFILLEKSNSPALVHVGDAIYNFLVRRGLPTLCVTLLKKYTNSTSERASHVLLLKILASLLKVMMSFVGNNA